MNITELLDLHHILYKREGHHHCRTGWIQIDCPFCGVNTHKWHMGFSIEGNYFNCWRCGSHPLWATLTQMKVPAKDIKQLTEKEPLEKRRPETQGKLQVPAGLAPMKRAHRQYLESRGYDPEELAKLWGIQGIGIAPRLEWRLWIPIIYHGITVSWTTRSIGNSEPRYISAGYEQQLMNHKELLYGEDFARYTIIVCEGPADVWRIGPGAVSVMGVIVTPSQLKRIIDYPRRVICFDNDKTGHERAERLASRMATYAGETYITKIETGNDPGSMSIDEVKELRNRFLK